MTFWKADQGAVRNLGLLLTGYSAVKQINIGKDRGVVRGLVNVGLCRLVKVGW